MSSKSQIGKEYQGNVFQFFIFLVALVGYLFLYDRSLELFFQDLKYVFELNFSDHHFLNTIFWIVGFWGMIVVLNLNNKYLKYLFWVFLIFSSTVNFAYNKIQGTYFEFDTFSGFFGVMSQFLTIETTALAKFLFVNVIMMILAVTLKPLSVSLNKAVIVALVIVIVLSCVISNGQSIQAIYYIPLVFCYQLFFMVFSLVKGGTITK